MENAQAFPGRRRRRYLLHFDEQKIRVLCLQKLGNKRDGPMITTVFLRTEPIYPSSTCFRWHDRLAACLLGFCPPQNSEQELHIILLHHLAEIPCNRRLNFPKKKEKERSERSLLLRHLTAKPPLRRPWMRPQGYRDIRRLRKDQIALPFSGLERRRMAVSGPIGCQYSLLTIKNILAFGRRSDGLKRTELRLALSETNEGGVVCFLVRSSPSVGPAEESSPSDSSTRRP